MLTFLKFSHKIIFISIIIIEFHSNNIKANNEHCPINKNENCNSQNEISYRYILYDVNPPEGFNLRRDVYLRLAVFVHNLIKSEKTNLQKFKLVLPPWSDLYHWRSKENNKHIPWSQFFDIKSLQKFAPVIEMYQFFNEIGKNYEQLSIDEVYILQNFEEMFKTGKFEDKLAVNACQEDDYFNFYDYTNLTSDNIKCLSFHGRASLLSLVLEKSNARTFLFHHAEIVLHDRYGDNIYWQGRRSMRFSKKLHWIANEFRIKYLNSSDESDNTIIPDDWRQEKPHRNAKGGPYISVHLRRRDFLRGRPSEVPDLSSAANQIKKLLEKHNLKTVFVATDAPINEFENLKEYFPKQYSVIKFIPTKEQMKKYKDGGIAIIEQIICSHAYYFVGTHESTFSFRIQEEREILGFPVERTFNRLCGNKNKKCEKPSLWKIVY